MKKLNCIAHNVKKPQKPAMASYEGAAAYLTQNRKGIAKLRMRGFTWGQIADTFNRLGINIDYNNLYQWQLRTFRQAPKNKFKVGDMIRPQGQGKKFLKTSGIVASISPIRRTMMISSTQGEFEVPALRTMFKAVL